MRKYLCILTGAVLLATPFVALPVAPAEAASVTVDTTNDVADGDTSSIANLIAAPGGDGVISLREAIEAANNSPGADTIEFAIPVGLDPGCDVTSGVCTIQPLTPLPPLTDSDTTIDGYTQPTALPAAGATPAALRIVLDGLNVPAGTDGLQVKDSAGHIIKGLVIHRFTRHGIYFENGLAPGTHIEGCHIGTDYLGVLPMPNTEDGIHLSLGTSNNIIGGDSSTARNVISGNGSDGIELENASTSNQISANYIGVDSSGLLPLGNAGVGVNVRDDSSSNNIGGGVSGMGNVISANGADGIVLNNSMTRENVISGNIIGLGVDGLTDRGNGQNGIQIVNGADTNTIGGTTPDERNIISGNTAAGVLIWFQFTDDNVVKGNFIGTDVTGTLAVGNSQGVRITVGAQGNVIGGVTPDERNVISGNSGYGVELQSDLNVISGNYIGTDVSGTASVSNGEGIYLYGGDGNVIGGDTPGERNVISGNTSRGIDMQGVNAMDNEIIGNYIGVDASGTAVLGNGTIGVSVSAGANSNKIGQASSGQGNLISGNQYGVVISGSDTNDNTVENNLIGTNSTGMLWIPNLFGVQIKSGAQNNIIGGEASGAGNLISGNAWGGILIQDPDTDFNVVCGNTIGLDSTGSDPLANNGIGVELLDGPDQNVIGGETPGCRNVVSGNAGDGVYISGSSTLANVVAGNLIGLDSGGTLDLGNTENGVRITGQASNNIIGGESAGARNIISGNNQDGVHISGSGADANRVIGNYIGTDESGTAGVGNTINGIWVNGGPADTEIGGDTAIEGNLISSNGNSGVRVDGTSTTGTMISANLIGVNASVTAPLANAHNGVMVTGGANNNVIGGDLPAERNVLSGNLFRGISLIGPATNNNTVKGNYIGTDATGLGSLGNGSHGVLAADAANLNTIGPGNLIAFNADDGVNVDGALAITITQNSIHSNGDLGIDLIGGANNGMAAPAIIQTTPGSIVVEGLIFQPDATVEVFSNPDNPGEGKTYLGSVPASGGVFVLTVPCTSDRYLTATATDPGGNTSEFSATFTSAVRCVYLPLIQR